MTFLVWLKNKNKKTAFELWLIYEAQKYKLRTFRDFSNLIWFKGKFYPLCRTYSEKLCELFDKYDQAKRNKHKN